MFLVEALVMGMVGSLVGIGLGYLLAVGAERLLSEVAAQIFSYVATQQPPIFRADYALTSFAIGTITSLIGAWLPPGLRRGSIRSSRSIMSRSASARQSREMADSRSVSLLIIAGLLCVAFAPLRVSLDYQFFYPLLMIAGLILILPKLAELIARLLRPLMDRVFGTEGVLAVESMIQSPRRTTATVGALMIGLSFVFSTASYVRSYQQNGRAVDEALHQCRSDHLDLGDGPLPHLPFQRGSRSAHRGHSWRQAGRECPLSVCPLCQ
jgi:putative ABC transport system permease protein